MRRAILAVVAGGTLLTGAACDSDATTTTDTAAPSPSAAPATSEPALALPDYSANTRLVCGRLKSLYTGELKDLGTSLGKMISYKETKQAAEADKAENAAAADLKAAAKKIRKETARAADPELRVAGAGSAAKLELSAKDRKYFDRVRTLKDLNRTIEDQLAEWLTPVAGYCGPA